MKKPVEPSFKWINPDGTPTQYFAELILNLSRNGLSDTVSTTEPTNGQVLTFNGTTNRWEPA